MSEVEAQRAATYRVLTAVCQMFDGDENWDVRDVDGVGELAEMVGYALPAPKFTESGEKVA